MQKRATRIKKGDVVFVLTGKEKGKTGKVLDIDHEKERAFVEKLMVVKRSGAQIDQ
jgi:large subunit ribosomal protein L24